MYAQRYGSRIVPAEIAVPVTEEARAQQGLPSPTTVMAAQVAEEPAVAPRSRRAYGRYAAGVCGFIVGAAVAGLYMTRR